MNTSIQTNHAHERTCGCIRCLHACVVVTKGQTSKRPGILIILCARACVRVSLLSFSCVVTWVYPLYTGLYLFVLHSMRAFAPLHDPFLHMYLNPYIIIYKIQEDKLLYFEWSLPWHYFDMVSDVIWKSIWHIFSDNLFWHSIGHAILKFYSGIFWHDIWHLFWHRIWHSFWHLYDIFSGFYLASILTFFLASIVFFC